MKFYFVFILSIVIQSLFAQEIVDNGSYIINNYTPDDYEASTQIFSIEQDTRGVMYFGNFNGLIEFEGNNWNKYELPNKALPHALAHDNNGKIYIGAANEIGYLSSLKFGEAKYFSLLKYLPENERNFNEVIKIFFTSDGVYFLLLDKIFQYTNDTVLIHKPDLPAIWGYGLFDNLILTNRNKGIHLFRNGEIVLLPHSNKILKDHGVYEVIEYDEDRLLILTEFGGLYTYNIRNILKTIDENNTIRYEFKYDELIEEIPSEVNKYVSQNRLSSGAKINENLYGFGTFNGGVIFIDKKGFVQGVVNKNRGLNDNAVSTIFVDMNKDIWLGLNYGIAHIVTSVPITLYNEVYNLDDAVLSTIEFDETRYFGTMNGIFSLPSFNINTIGNKPKLNNVHNLQFSAWDFINFKDNLFATGERGIYQIRGNKGKELVSEDIAYVFEPSDKFKDHMFMGLTTGLKLVKVKNNPNNFATVEVVNEMEDFNKAVRKILSDKHGNIWVTSQYNSVYYVKFGDLPTEHEIFNFDTAHGLPSPDFNYIHYINSKIVVSTEKGLYKYIGPDIIESISDTIKYFVPDTAYNSVFKGDSILPYDIKCVNDSIYWIQTDNSIGKLETLSHGMYWNDSVSKIIPPAYYMNYENDSIIWVCIDRGIQRYNVKKHCKSSYPFNTIIRKIALNQDSIVFEGFNCNEENGEFKCYKNINEINNSIPEYEFEFNSIEFQYSSTFYISKDKVTYSYKLEGFDKEWSAWTNEVKKEYTNLNEGRYTFFVKSKNIFEKQSDIAQYTFVVKPPWFRTLIAYLSYFIVLGILFYIGIRLNSKRLKAANIRLEQTVRKRTEEIRKQKNELEKLSIVASETDNAVFIMDARGNIEWVNDGFTRLYGYTQDELLHIKGRNIVNASANIYIKEVLNSVIQNKESIIYESMFVSKENGNVWVQTTLTPILNSVGDVIKLVAIDTDIGKLKTAEEEISQQKEELQTQSELLEETNIELERTNLLITDSIKYAKLIQDAILPKKDEITKEFPESFIFYQPRSIVSGDFYWIEHRDDKTFIAVVDCTGHGVPGAFMSLIGSILLNEIINDKKCHNPAVILDRLNKGVINALGQTGNRDEIQDDGMEMTLLVVDKKAKKVNVALANHNAYFFKGNEMRTIEGDIFSIGGVLSKSIKVEFTNHELHVDNGDVIYMFSDGFQDQFGGEQGKKYMATRFKNLLNQIHGFSMQIQEHKVKNEFKSWQGHEKQVDDVLVVGLKFSEL
jgi:PAS domain S-box-containing protein